MCVCLWHRIHIVRICVTLYTSWRAGAARRACRHGGVQGAKPVPAHPRTASRGLPGVRILLATYLLTLHLLPRVRTLPTCCSLPCAHARTPACFTLTHKLKRTFLSRLPTYYSLVTRRVRSSRDCAMALSHLSATPPPSRRRANYYCLPPYCTLLYTHCSLLTPPHAFTLTPHYSLLTTHYSVRGE